MKGKRREVCESVVGIVLLAEVATMSVKSAVVYVQGSSVAINELTLSGALCSPSESLFS